MIKKMFVCDRCGAIINRSKEIDNYKSVHDNENPYNKYPSKVPFEFADHTVSFDLCFSCAIIVHNDCYLPMITWITRQNQSPEA